MFLLMSVGLLFTSCQFYGPGNLEGFGFHPMIVLQKLEIGR